MQKSYSLEEYKIIETGINELSWEAHFGLGALQKGKCFKKGNLLFIGPAENVDAGFLKGEFLDHIDKLPVWLKTRYYCKGCDVYHCKTGRRVTKNEMRWWMIDKPIHRCASTDERTSAIDSNIICGVKKIEAAAFRLQRYEIVIKPDGRVVWATHAGPNTVSMGNCRVLEDILFIDSVQIKQSVTNKRKFIGNLRELPLWDQTRYFTSKLSLIECKSGSRVLENVKTPHKKSSPEKNHGVMDRKDIPQAPVSNDPGQGAFSTQFSQIFDSAAESVASYRERIRNLQFKSGSSNISRRFSGFRTLNIKKWIISGFAVIFLMIALVCAVLMGYWNEHQEKSHHEKGKHSSNHHMEQ